MEKTKLATMNLEEKKEIQDIFMRKAALEELLQIIDLNNITLYERIIFDITECRTKMGLWWDAVSEKHGWKYGQDYEWNVDFSDGSICVMKTEKKIRLTEYLNA